MEHRLFTGAAVRRFAGRGAVVAVGLTLGLSTIAASPTAARPTSKHLPTGAVVIGSASSGATDAGRVLVDGQGFSLYDFSGDAFDQVTGCLPTNTTSTGTPCTDVWKPVLATGPLVARGGVQAGLLGTETRTGLSAPQVTYRGEPLYTFAADTAPGQQNGQNVTAFLGIWRLVSVKGGPASGRTTIDLRLSPSGAALEMPAGTPRPAYVLSADGPDMTTCTGECAAIWPPVLTDHNPVAGTGVSQRGLGVLRRPDGTKQVTYFGRPLYLFAFDLASGSPATTEGGDNFIDPPAFGVWDTLSPAGTPVTGPITLTTETVGGQTVLGVEGNTDVAGGAATATLFSFSADTATTSACTGQCATAWPPLLTSAPPIAGSGVDASQLGTIQRPDGSFQVTYAGHPLYLFSQALDTTGTGDGVTAFGGTFATVPTS